MSGFAKKFSVTTIAALFLFTFIFIFPAPLQAALPITICVEGQQLALNDSTGQPVILDDRTYVPLRVISENLGAKVDWIGDSEQVIINTEPDLYTYSIPENISGEIQIIINGKPLIIPADYGRAFISNLNRTMIPLRIVGEALDYEVDWINETRTVVINSKPDEVENPADDIDNAVDPKNQLLNDLALFSSNLKLKDGSVINSSELSNRDASEFSAEQLDAFKLYLEQLSKYPQSIELSLGETVKISDLSIMGDSILTAGQINDWMSSQESRKKADMQAAGREFMPFPDLAQLYIEIGEEYGIRGDIAFFQAVKETNYFQFTGQVTPSQNNYCGLWATGNPLTGQESYNGADPDYVIFEAGLHGASFISPAAGVEAHIQHLYAYATKNVLPTGKILIDPRFSLVNKGIAPTWQQLNARWAVPGTTYGQSIIYDYWYKAF